MIMKFFVWIIHVFARNLFFVLVDMRTFYALFVAGTLGACPDIVPGQYRAWIGENSFVTVTKTAGSNVLGVEVDAHGNVSESTLEYSIQPDCSIYVDELTESYGFVVYDATKQGIAVGNSLFLERV